MPFHPYATRPDHTCPNAVDHCANEVACDRCGGHICAHEPAFITSVEERYDQEHLRVTGVRFVRHTLCRECYYRVEI